MKSFEKDEPGKNELFRILALILFGIGVLLLLVFILTGGI